MEHKLLYVAALLWAGFFLAFFRCGKLRLLTSLFRRTKSSMDMAVRKRLLESRMRLSEATGKEGFWLGLERQLWYSGLKRRFPALGAELFFLLVLFAGIACFVAGTLLSGIWVGLLCALAALGVVYGVLTVGKAMEMHAVNESLVKFLDFLGNYSVTAGDVISVFGQISKFMDEPLQGVLEQCCVEAQTTGDVGMALLAMADKVEHPQFRELVRNIEVSCRYSADFSALVTFSRRSVREYMRSTRERKSLLREAGINMALLLGMSVVSLLTVNGLLEASVWNLLFFSIPGRVALGIVAGILFLFAMQAYQLEG